MAPPADPLVLAALGAAVYLVVAPPSADLAAQEYRADLGLTLWNNGWFAGHHTPGYSVLFPPLGGLLGVRLTGALAAVAAAGLFTLLARRHWDERGDAAAWWFAAGTVAVLLNGRMTFLLGVAIGLGALLALAHERRAVAVGLAALTTLASPVAGLFVALAAAAWALAAPRERGPAGAAIAAAALAPVAIMLVAVPAGRQRAVRALGVLAGARGQPAARGAAAGSGARAAQRRAALRGRRSPPRSRSPPRWAATRPGSARSSPARSCSARCWAAAAPVLVAALAVAFAYWPLYPAVRDVVRASGDPSIEAGYHAPLIEFLRAQARPARFRVEIPFTENHWEARHVAPQIPLARGWERQLDRRFGALFYDGALDAARYRRWLDERAVAFVALPDVALDAAGRDEARLIAAGLPFLRPVWRNAHWRVFAVARAAPLAAGPGRRARDRDAEPDGRHAPRRPRRQRARAGAPHALVARDRRPRLRERGAGRDDPRPAAARRLRCSCARA